MDRKLDVRKIYESVKEKITFKPEAALVLGSGLKVQYISSIFI